MGFSAKTSRIEEEGALRERVAALPEFPSLALLTAEKLRELAAREGVDFATALLYDRVIHSPQHSPFITRIHQWQSNSCKIRATGDVIVAIVPAAFYKENPDSGADGRLIREEAIRLGLRCELIPLASTGTFADNSKTILDWLVKHRGEKVILISLCKGGADVKFTLGLPNAQEHFCSVLAWVNICGTLNGSPVAELLLASKTRFFVAWLYCKCRGLDLTFLRELAPSPQGPVSAALQLPASMQLISLIGFPLRQHLTNRFMRQCHKLVSRQGPTDGGVLLADACHLPGVIYPVWGADHYLRPEVRARRIIASVLEYLTGDYNRKELCLTNETQAIDQIAQMPLA
jgi:hypothetical protein